MRDWNGLPPLEFQSPPDLKAVFQKALARLGLKDRLREATLGDQWPQLVGATLASHCKPGIIRHGVLTVHVDHSAWLHQITLSHKADILSTVQKHFPHLKVTDLNLKIR